MAQLSDLSDEIVDNICSHLHSDELGSKANRTGLYGLVRASKRCYRIAISHLYYSLSPVTVTAGLLAQTLLRNPNFAALVRGVDLEDYWPARNVIDPAARMMFFEEAGDLIAVQDEHSLEEEDDDPLGFGMSLEEDRNFHRRFTDFVLTRLPQLKVLAFTLSDQLFDPATIAALSSRPQDFLPMVRELEIRHDDTESGFKMSEIMPFLTGNTITKVTLFACAGFGDDTTQVCPSITNLQLQRTALEPGEFEKLVRCFPKLEILALETADSTVTEYMDNTPSTFQIGIALEPLKDTLQSLTIDQRERFDMDEDDDDGPYSKKPVGSLRGFHKLEKLVIWQYDLTRSREDEEAVNPDGVEEEDSEVELEEGFHKNEGEDDKDNQLVPWTHKLPKSLQTLGVIGATKEIEPGLWRLTEIKGEEYPNLTKVFSCRQVKALKAAFRKVGIDYEYRLN